MHKITHDTPPKPCNESPLGLARASDVLRVAKELAGYWPVTARSIYYNVISSPLSSVEYWMAAQGKRKGQPP